MGARRAKDTSAAEGQKQTVDILPFLDGKTATLVREAIRSMDEWTSAHFGETVIIVQESQEQQSGELQEEGVNGVTTADDAAQLGEDATPPTQPWPPRPSTASRTERGGENHSDPA